MNKALLLDIFDIEIYVSDSYFYDKNPPLSHNTNS